MLLVYLHSLFFVILAEYCEKPFTTCLIGIQITSFSRMRQSHAFSFRNAHAIYVFTSHSPIWLASSPNCGCAPTYSHGFVPYFDCCTIITRYYLAGGPHLVVYQLQCTLPQNSRFGRNLCEIAALAQCMARTARAATRFTLATENYNLKSTCRVWIRRRSCVFERST